jgi:Flp pilus assembly protein TadG
MIKFKNPMNFARAEQGVAAIETAIILPFLLLLYFGMIDITALISHNRKVTYAASVVADLVTQNRTSILKATLTDYFKAAELIMEPTPANRTRIVVTGYRNVGGAVTQMWSTNNGMGPTCGAGPSTAEILPLMTATNDVIVAQACLEYTPYVATFVGVDILGATSFDVEQAVMVRPRSTTMLTCYNLTVGAAVCT